tara:strand:+ start:5964 stop:6161 length:198 start_codon:yes stop_codon:yes gene_type:complete
MSKKLYANFAAKKMQNLIKNIALLEQVDRQRMSQSGKKYLDDIWKTLGMPTYDEALKTMKKEKNY